MFKNNTTYMATYNEREGIIIRRRMYKKSNEKREK